MRKFRVLVTLAFVAATAGCASSYNPVIAAQNHAIVESSAAKKLPASERRALSVAAERASARGISLAGKPLAAIVAEQRAVAISEANARLIAESAAYNTRAHAALKPTARDDRSDATLDAQNRPAITGAYETVSRSL